MILLDVASLYLAFSEAGIEFDFVLMTNAYTVNNRRTAVSSI